MKIPGELGDNCDYLCANKKRVKKIQISDFEIHYMNILCHQSYMTAIH